MSAGPMVLPGMPAPPVPTIADEVARVLRLRDQLALLAMPGVVDVEPLEPGFVAVPVDLFERLVHATVGPGRR